MQPIQLFDPASSTYTYLLFDPDTREALIIDPVEEQLQRDLDALEAHGLLLVWALETHGHGHHTTSPVTPSRNAIRVCVLRSPGS